jgi:hypothetical protein
VNLKNKPPEYIIPVRNNFMSLKLVHYKNIAAVHLVNAVVNKECPPARQAQKRLTALMQVHIYILVMLFGIKQPVSFRFIAAIYSVNALIKKNFQTQAPPLNNGYILL